MPTGNFQDVGGSLLLVAQSTHTEKHFGYLYRQVILRQILEHLNLFCEELISHKSYPCTGLDTP